jgi:hypothetical protein
MAENETEKQETVTEPSLSDQKPAEQPPKPKKKVNLAARKKLKYGGIATAITCIVTAAVIGVNVLVSRVVEKYPLKIDLTETGMYEISDESRNFLRE